MPTGTRARVANDARTRVLVPKLHVHPQATRHFSARREAPLLMRVASCRSGSRVHAVMVCDHCSSDSHVTGYKDCPNYRTVCKDAGHRRNSKACPNRTCTYCSTVGLSARQCTFCSICEHGHKEANRPDRLCSACNSSKHKTSRSSDCPYHQVQHVRSNRTLRKTLPASRGRFV